MTLKNPFNKNIDPLNHDIYERFLFKFDADKICAHLSERIYSEVMGKIEENIQQINPELLVNFTHLYQHIENLIREHDDTIKSIEKKSKKIFESSSLAEDVYKLRDEVNKMKEATKYFAKIKKAFD